MPLDPEFPEWGESRYVDLRLTGTVRLADALNHLYVLLPVLDDAKHYWVSTDEVDKLLRAGEGWLAAHPERELITRRYLAHQRELASGRARPGWPRSTTSSRRTWTTRSTAPGSRRARAGRRRSASSAGAPCSPRSARPAPGRVVDLGCGEGVLVRDLLRTARSTEVVGVDVSRGRWRSPRAG